MNPSAGEVTHRALAPVDIAIIAVYFAVIFAIAYYFSRRKKTSTDYFLASRNVGWFAIGASLFVSNISTEHFIGLAGSGATSGLAVGHFEWLACMILLILGWVFVPFYLRSNVFTMPEFLERRFSRQCSVYLASISIIAYVFTKISVHLYAAAVVLERVVGWSPLTAAVILVVATGVYTVAGGLAAVIYTDLVQTLILIAGAVILTFIGLDRVGGFAGLRAAVPADYFHMIKPFTHSAFPWTGIFLGAPILGIWYWCTDQSIVQRVLSAKDEGHAKAGTIFAGFLKILPVFILVLPGIMAFALFKNLFRLGPGGEVLNGDIAYPTMIINLLPEGLIGLMIAALLAALMGAMSSVFNSASTLVTLDFYKKLRPDASETRLVNFGRVATGIMVVLGPLHPFDQQPALHLSPECTGLHQPAHRRVFHPRRSLAPLERDRGHLLPAHRVRARRGPIHSRNHRARPRRPLLYFSGDPMDRGNQLPALCHPDVCGMLSCVGRSEPRHAPAGAQQAGGTDVRDSSGKNRYLHR
jgi:solute:Na+ symporter, SSS family